MSKIFLEAFCHVLNHVEATVANIDVIVAEKLFDQKDEVRYLSGRKNARDFDLFDELIKNFLFLFPLLKFEEIVDPLRCRIAQYINRIFVFTFVIFLIVNRL
jgi:hypothetical protein